MDRDWTNPALSLQPNAYSMHSGAAEPGKHRKSCIKQGRNHFERSNTQAHLEITHLHNYHVDNTHVDTPYGNTIYGGNHCNGNVNDAYGHNSYDSNISYDGNPNIASASVVNPSVVNPNFSDLDVGNPLTDKTYAGNALVGSAYASHGVSPGYDEYNKTPLLTGTLSYDVPLIRGRVNANFACPNTTYGGNHYIDNSYPGTLNNTYGYNPHGSNIIYDNTNVASPNVASSSVLNSSVVNPNFSDLNGVGNSLVDNMYAGNTDIGSMYASHKVSPGYNEYNKAPLATGVLTHDVPLVRGRVDGTVASANTNYGGNRYIDNSYLGNLNKTYGHNLYDSDIIYDNTYVARPSFCSPSVVNPNASNPDDVDNSFVGNTYVADTYVGNTSVSHGVSPGHYESNKTPLATGAFTHRVPLGRGQVDTTIASGAAGPINPPTLASNTTISDRDPLRAATNHNGQATSSLPDKNRFLCLHEGCFQEFGRIGDLERHWKMHQPPEFECPFAGCRRKGAEGFTRKDHRNNHIKKCKFQPRS